MLWAVLAAWSLAPRDSALSHARQEQHSDRVTLQGCLQPQDGEILAENFSSQGHRDVALVQGGGEGSWGLHPSTQEGLRTWREPPHPRETAWRQSWERSRLFWKAPHLACGGWWALRAWPTASSTPDLRDSRGTSPREGQGWGVGSAPSSFP